MDSEHKPCIACAEPIRLEAMLCRFCSTRQDDPSFLPKAAQPNSDVREQSSEPVIQTQAPGKKAFPWKVVLPGVAAVVVGAVWLGISLGGSVETEEVAAPEVQGSAVPVEVVIPSQNENSDHGYLLEDDRIPRLGTCEEWDEFWVYEGPAVSFAAAGVFNDPSIAVSTEIYVKNSHLDSDFDGVICYLEYQRTASAPQTESPDTYAEPWQQAAVDVRTLVEFRDSTPHPMDFAASPSVDPEHAEVIYDGVELALKFWAPFIDSDRPLAMTVVHPNDKAWFLDRWEELGRDNTGEFWWGLAEGGGGGAVGWTAEGIPNMYFMTSAAYPPPTEEVDYYVHEVMHFFQTLNLGAEGEGAAPCWYGEGTATFVGFAMAFPNDLPRTFERMDYERSWRAGLLMDYYDQNGGLDEEILEQQVLNSQFDEVGDTCQHEFPQFGYNLGMFVAEKFVIDHGFDALIEMSKQMGRMDLPDAFEEVVGTNYESWVRAELFPYLIETITTLG